LVGQSASCTPALLSTQVLLVYCCMTPLGILTGRGVLSLGQVTLTLTLALTLALTITITLARA